MTTRINAGQRVRWAERSEGVVVRCVPAYKRVRGHLTREQRERVCHAYDEVRGFRRAVVEDAAGRWHIVADGRLTIIPKAHSAQD